MLGALPLVDDPDVLSGAGSADDAAVYRIADDRALVATVDFFTPIVDDPVDFGAIAAANSLSDVYAMGGRPLFALSLVAFPRERLDAGVLELIIKGGAVKLAEVGVPVVGGHSIDDAEPKFGYAVIGEVDPGRVIGRAGAQPGDELYLTKPLGSGLVATAIKNRRCPPGVAARAVAVMTHLNRQAAEAMLRCGASAATDVTGFGLIGHLMTFGVGADLELSRIPFQAGVRDLAAQDLFPDGTRRNLADLGAHVDWGGLAEVDRLILCDAQTSGGILAAIPPQRASEFEAALADAPYPAARIGSITGPGRIRIRP